MGEGLTATDIELLRPKLVSYFWHSAGDAAEDLVATVLADSALRIERGETILATWIWRGCRWAAVSHLRALVARHESPGVFPETIPTPASLDVPAEGFEEATEGALAKLTDRQREVVSLQADGYSREEIGDRLGCSAQAVGAILHRARAAVKARSSTLVASTVTNLSPREVEVIAALADGLDHAGIGRKLGISPETVKNHLTSAYGKLHAANAAQAAAVAVRTGLIQ